MTEQSPLTADELYRQEMLDIDTEIRIRIIKQDEIDMIDREKLKEIQQWAKQQYWQCYLRYKNAREQQ